MRRRRRSFRRRALVGAGTLLVLASLASVFPFLWPNHDAPSHADAIILLSGDHGERLAVAMGLIERGVARILVFNGTPDRAAEDELCAGGGTSPSRAFEAVCLRPNPDGTRQEARAAAVLAEHRGWRRIVVVTSDFHVTRSRLLFERCFDGDVDVVGGDPHHPPGVMARLVLHEWLAVGHALSFDRTC